MKIKLKEEKSSILSYLNLGLLAFSIAFLITSDPEYSRLWFSVWYIR